jgi:hypothetical protein
MADTDNSGGFSLYPFQDVPGLLTPQDQGNVKTQTLLSAAAGLLQASGYTRLPHSIFADLGKGLAGGLQGYQDANKNALTNEALRQQSAARQLQMLQAVNAIKAFGGNVPPDLLARLGIGGGGAAPGAPAAAAPGNPAAPTVTGGNGGGAPAAPTATIPQATGAPGAAPVPQMAPAAPVAGAPGSPIAAALAALPPGARAIIQGMGQSGNTTGAMEALAKASAPTDAEKDARDPAVLEYQRQQEQQKSDVAHSPSVAAFNLQQEQQKDDVARYGKKYDAVTQLGEQAAAEHQQLTLAKSILNDPNFVSGAGNAQMLGYKKLNAQFGGDPNASMPNEAFNGAIKSQILDTIKSLKGTGQIRVTEIDLIKQAVASADHSVAGNRTLVEIADRLNQRAMQVDELARGYNNGHLDAGFDTAARKIQEQPVLTPEELKDPRLIAPAQFKSPQDMVNAGLPSGTPFKTPDGRIGYAP